MFRITNTENGAVIGMTAAPNYIKQVENGCYNLCPEPEASGIVFGGTVYHLLGRKPLPDVETVMLEENDIGPLFAAAQASIADAEAMNVDHEYRLTLVELGLAGSETI